MIIITLTGKNVKKRHISPNISLASAPSAVRSPPEITPISFACVPTSYTPMETPSKRHWDMSTHFTPPDMDLFIAGKSLVGMAPMP